MTPMANYRKQRAEAFLKTLNQQNNATTTTPADSPVIYGASLVIPTNPSWANSPIHQEVQEWEKESIRAQDVNKPSETLVAERDRLDDQLDQIILRLGETQERMIDAERQRDRLAEALRSIKNELGVPQPEYPAPVANAVKIADGALQFLTSNTKL
jgi:hypothetical protein